VRLQLSVSESLVDRLAARAEQSGATVSQTATVLLDRALSLWEPDETIAPSRPERTPPAAPAPKPKAPEKMPKSGGLVMPGAPREPHVMKNRFAEKCETLDLVDGVCPTCGYRDA